MSVAALPMSICETEMLYFLPSRAAVFVTCHGQPAIGPVDEVRKAHLRKARYAVL
jgi:hypothetical protein